MSTRLISVLALVLALTPALTLAAGSPRADSAIVMDGRFSGFDAIAYLRKTRPSLASHAEAISHWAAYYGVNPLLLARAAERHAATAPLASASIRRLAGRIATLGPDPATPAEAASALGQILSVPTGVAEGFLAATRAEMLNAGLAATPAAVEDHPPALDLPFPPALAWQFNGVHSWTGNDNGAPMSSLDFASSWSQDWGDDTSNDRVSAAHDGEVTVLSDCFVQVQHPGGWGTRYYHLDEVSVVTGQKVRAGDPLAIYANERTQALCSGGHSTGPHLHFALQRDGRYHSLRDVALSGYRVHPGDFSYDTNRDRMWLEKRGRRYYAFDETIGQEPGDNTIDYRYNGMWYSPDHDGHGMNIEITEARDGEASRKTVFLVMYTYDDAGAANYYVGNRDFQRWRADETQEIDLLQTAGGDLTDLRPIDFDDPGQVMPAGQAELRFLDCNRAQVDLSMFERTAGQPVGHSLELTRLIGVPPHVCDAASLPLP